MNNNFEIVFKELGFKLYPKRIEPLTWVLDINHETYKVRYEGYAYVLYKELTLYINSLRFLFNLYNKFVKKNAEIAITYDVPIMSFKDTNDLVTIIKILTKTHV